MDQSKNSTKPKTYRKKEHQVEKVVEKKVEQAISKAVNPKKGKNPQKVKHTEAQTKALARPKLPAVINKILFMLLQAIADPVNSVCRWPDKYNSKPTAVMHPMQRLSATWGSNGELAGDELIGFGFRSSAVRAFVIADQNQSGQTFSYSMYGVTNSQVGVFNVTAPSLVWNQTFFSTDPDRVAYQPISIPYGKCTTSYQPHGPMMYAGVCKEEGNRRFFWVDASHGSTAKITYTATAGFTIGIDVWSSNGYTPKALNITCASGTNQTVDMLASVATPGYFAFTVSSATAQSISMSMVITGNNEVFCHLPLPGLESMITSVDDHRVIGASLMYTNTAAPLNREGKILPYQLSPGQYWHDYISGADTSFNTVSALPGAVPFEIPEGAYIFHKPTSDDDWDFKDEWYCVDGTLIDVYYSLDDPSPPILIIPVIETSNGQSGYWTICQGIEFFSTSQMFNFAVPTIPSRYADEALDQVKHLIQVHSNALHLKQIFANIVAATKKAGRFLADNLPTAISYLEKYGPTIAKYAPVVGALL
jgi:hypothetical protein